MAQQTTLGQSILCTHNPQENRMLKPLLTLTLAALAMIPHLPSQAAEFQVLQFRIMRAPTDPWREVWCGDDSATYPYGVAKSCNVRVTINHKYSNDTHTCEVGISADQVHVVSKNAVLTWTLEPPNSPPPGWSPADYRFTRGKGIEILNDPNQEFDDAVGDDWDPASSPLEVKKTVKNSAFGAFAYNINVEFRVAQGGSAPPSTGGKRQRCKIKDPLVVNHG